MTPYKGYFINGTAKMIHPFNPLSYPGGDDPRDPRDFDRLVEAIRPQSSPLDLDAIIGTRGPIAPAEFCNGVMVPIIVFDQIYTFDRDALIKAVPRPEKTTAKQFEAAAGEVLDRILQMTDNAGATDDHRALN